MLNDGRKISYALGLDVEIAKDGNRDITHGGSTAGYQTFLARFPDKKLSVAVLCNGTSPNGSGLAYGVFEEIFGPPAAPAKVESVSVPEDQLKKYVGIWKNEVTRNVNRIVLVKGELKLGSTAFKPQADGSFTLGMSNARFKDGSPMTAAITNPDGSVTRLTMVSEWKPTTAEMSEFAGDWHSEEAQARVNFLVEGDKSFIVIHPVAKLPLTPIYKDHFSTPGYVVWVTRDAKGKIKDMHVGTGRMRDMLFERVKK